MRAFVLGGVVCVVVALSGPAPGQDIASTHSHRDSVPDSLAVALDRNLPRPPWSAIGRVNRRPGGFCSGTLIARDKVLTTAGCLWNQALGRWHAAEDVFFVAGYHLGSHVVNRRVVAMEFAAGIAMTRRGRPRKARDDWAILTLARPIAESRMIRPIETIRLRARPRPQMLGMLVRAGFSPARPHTLTRAYCKAVAFFNGATLMHDCGATYAESGFPILVETDEGWRLLGLQMTTTHERAPENAVGMALVVTAIGQPSQVRR